MTVIAQDDHLTAGAWAACALLCLYVRTGGLSSICEMIILRNNSHGGIIRVCMGIFTTALRNKKYVKRKGLFLCTLKTSK